MAVIQPVRSVGFDAKSVTITWTNITTADTGAQAFIGDLEFMTVQVTSGGAGTAQVRVSNDGTNFVGLTATLTIGAAAPEAVGIQTLAVQPQFIDISAVATATSTVILSGRIKDA